MDGKSAAMNGDPGVTAVSVMKLADNKIRETDRRGDKIVGVATMTVSADGKMMVDSEDKQRGTTLTYKAIKQ